METKNDRKKRTLALPLLLVPPTAPTRHQVTKILKEKRKGLFYFEAKYIPYQIESYKNNFFVVNLGSWYPKSSRI